jgi:hypothetical protein
MCHRNHRGRPERHEEEPEESWRNDKRFRELVRKPWFRVIDIKGMKLTRLLSENGYHEPYVALSYRWATEDHITTRFNLSWRERDGGLESASKTMPQTIHDAIELVRRLKLKCGEREVRYMWIDSLCIVQDDVNSRSWELNAENMDLIFGNAFLTICAADKRPEYGLRAMRSQRPPEERQITPDLKLVVSRSPQYIIPASDWNKRGWTFQEHLLSRRCLVFAGNRIYFQCRISNYDDTGIDWSTDWRKSALLTVDEVKRRPIQFYMKAVSLYTGRNLTNPEDILKAFSAVSGLVGWYMCAPVFSGLPSSHFDFALLWRPKEGKGRRPGFPSWSWSGWQHEDDPGLGTSVHYPLNVLEGALINLHSWLLDRTWIVWYIHDEHSLQPLWCGYKPLYPERSYRIEGRWKGYDGYGTGEGQVIEVSEEVTEAGETKAIKAIKAASDTYGRVPRWTALPRTNFSPSIHPTSSVPLLRFYTWKCQLFIRADSTACSPGAKLLRVDVLDQQEDWCGTVVLDEEFALQNNERLCTFLALSEARRFTKEECPSWTYPIAKNVEDVEWDLLNVMVVMGIKRKEGELYERRGLGKVVQKLFERDQVWEEIALG